jgi:cell division protein ZapE
MSIQPTLSLTEWYLAQVANKHLLFNHTQLSVLQQLDEFSKNFNSSTITRMSISIIPQLIRKLFMTAPSIKLGYYIHGSVGRGKTMIINQLYATLNTSKKIRTHFHQFMDDIQKQLTLKRNINDPLKDIAAKLATHYKIIFLDEMHVDDIATAMILNNLFINLFKQGIYIIISSNYLPDELYKDGLMRERFLPAITQMKTHLCVLELNTKQDYRTITYDNTRYANSCSNSTTNNALNIPLNDMIDEVFIISQPNIVTINKLNNIFNQLITPDTQNIQNQQINNNTIIIKNRPLQFIKKHSHIIWFDFNVICGDNRSQLDYLELIQQFNWFIIQNTHAMTANDKNIARRFTWLIDILYDSKSKLVLASNVAIDMLYPSGDFANEFKRTISRLTEMQSTKYLNTLPIGISVLAET